MKYDLIIAGAGLGGLSFLHHYMERESPDWKILLIDPCTKTGNDRTWSFWSTSAPDYKCASSHIWDHLGFASDGFQRFDPISPYRYYTIRGIDFYQEVLNQIHLHPNIEFVQDEVMKITPVGGEVSVHTKHARHAARFVIDSITRPTDGVGYTWNFQNFLGWEVKTASAQFTANRPLLMDFRVPQHGAASFIYLLPFTETEALVEYTQFATSRQFDIQQYSGEVQSYIARVLGISQYEVTHEERGSIPMTNYPFEKKAGRVFRIGTVGGDTKATTGYTFLNVQESANRILDEISGKVSNSVKNPRFRFYDELLLEIIAKRPQAVKPIMSRLFQTQPMHRILKFLNEETTVAEEAAIFARLPWGPFLNVIKDQTYAFFGENTPLDSHRASELAAR